MSQHDEEERRLRYERVAETGFESFEDLEQFQATKREWVWCEVQGRETLHRDGTCLPCFMASLSREP